MESLSPDKLSNPPGGQRGHCLASVPALGCWGHADHLLSEAPEDDEGREAGGEGGQGQTGQQLGQQEGGPGVDTLPGLLVIPSARADNWGNEGQAQNRVIVIGLHVMEVEMIAMK